MKKLLFVLLMVLSGQVVAALEMIIPYENFAPGGPTTSLWFHEIGCDPTVLSVESGNAEAAVWVTELGAHYVTYSIYNIGKYPIQGNIKIRFGRCE